MADHGPLAVAFQIRRPWSRGKTLTVWHREKHGRDALTVCQKRYRAADGWWYPSRSWKLHFWHYRLRA